MNIKDEVFERLKSGESPEEVRHSYHSSSQVTEGFRLYQRWIQTQLNETQTALSAKKSELEQVNIAVERLKAEEQKLAENVGSLGKKEVSLSKRVDEKSEELNSLQQKIEALQKRGFTGETVARLSETVDITGPEVWHQLDSMDERARLSEDVAALRDAKTELESDIASAKEEKQRMKGQLRTMKAKVANYSEVLVACAKLEDVISETVLAENRLAEALRIEREINDRTTLAEKTHLNMLTEQQAVALKSIHDCAANANKVIFALLDSFQAELEKTKASGEEVGRLREKAAQLGELISWAQALTGIIESDEVLRQVPSALAVQLLQRLQCFVELKWPYVMVSPNQDALTQELRLTVPAVFGVKLSSVIKAAAEAIRRQSAENPS